MPIFLDRHFIEGATRHSIHHAHEKDLEIQDKYGCRFLTYWFDEERCTAFCLIDAPSREALVKVHDESHGDIPYEIIEVDPAIVESFLGRIKDPTPTKNRSLAEQIESAFRAIMFTDLKDSTLMTTMYGDQKALHFVHVVNVITRNALREYDGREVKHTGDGIMASFTSTEHAVSCARAIQRKLAEYNQSESAGDEELLLRIGISAGEPIEEHGDLFGSVVQTAARLCARAEPGGVMVSKEVFDLCDHIEFEELGDLSLKGFTEKIRAYRIR